MVITRRELFAGTLAAGLSKWPSPESKFENKAAALEKRFGGRLGVAVLDTGTMRFLSHRGSERFPMCSTSKALAAGYVLSRVDHSKESLDRKIAYDRTHLVTHSPTVAQHDSLSVRELCEAAITLSDNTAMNLLFASFGGPHALTAYLRSIGDKVTRLDRPEPELNEARPGDPRDTTTPLAMAATLHKLVLGDALSRPNRALLVDWLKHCQTGDHRIRAGVPKGWSVGRPPLVMAVFYRDSTASAEDRDAVIAEIGHVACL